MKAVAMLATLGAISLAASAPGAPPNPGPGFSSVSNLGPAWSPDGKRIAFTTYAYGRAQIAAIDVSGRRVVRLTNDAFSDFQPRFRRDGTLVFSGQDAGVDFVATLDRSGRTVKLPLPGSGADLSNVATSDEAPWFTRDGTVVLFWRTRADGRDSLYGVRTDSGRRYGPLAHAGPAGNYYGHYSWPDISDWSPRSAP